jgi:hypothetical protein
MTSFLLRIRSKYGTAGVIAHGFAVGTLIFFLGIALLFAYAFWAQS